MTKKLSIRKGTQPRITLKWSYHFEFAFVSSTGTLYAPRGLRFVCVLGRGQEFRRTLQPDLAERIWWIMVRGCRPPGRHGKAFLSRFFLNNQLWTTRAVSECKLDNAFAKTEKWEIGNMHEAWPSNFSSRNSRRLISWSDILIVWTT